MNYNIYWSANNNTSYGKLTASTKREAIATGREVALGNRFEGQDCAFSVDNGKVVIFSCQYLHGSNRPIRNHASEGIELA